MANSIPAAAGRSINPFLQNGARASNGGPVQGAAAQAAQALAAMDDDRLAKWARGAQTVGAFAYQLAAVRDPRERAALAQRYVPILLQNQFLTPEMAQSFDLSDAGLAQLQAMALNVSKQVDAEMQRRARRQAAALARGVHPTRAAAEARGGRRGG